MEIKQINNEVNGRFVAIVDEQEAGIMTYTWPNPDLFIIDHTEVNDSFNGLGLGKKLVAAAVEFARREGKKIIPVCPFAQAILKKNTDWHDVLN